MKCEACGEEVTVVGRTTLHYELVNKNHLADKGDIQIPFACQLCGAIDFKFTAVRDVAFIYPTPKVERIGKIWLPDDDAYVGGNLRERYRDPAAYVLSIGIECFHPTRHTIVDIKGQLDIGDKVYYQKNVPWQIDLPGPDGKIHRVVFCGFMDIYGVQNGRVS